MLSLSLLLIVLTLSALHHKVSARDGNSQRCRTTDDLGRIPWFLPNSTFHNFGFPLVRTLCDVAMQQNSSGRPLGCEHVKSMEFLYESIQELRFGNRSSTIIVDPHKIQALNVASSGPYVILAMFEILFGLNYRPSLRHWSGGMSSMFPPEVSAAATEISRRYDAFVQGKGVNPFADIPNHIMLQVEVPFNFVASIPVNSSPYGRTYKWIVGFHFGHRNSFYKPSDPTAHCTGANFHLGRGRMCSTSGVIPCPQYDYHRTRSYEVTPENRASLKKNIILFDDDQAEVNMERMKTDLMKLGGLDDLQVLKNHGRKSVDMPDLYKQVKMTIDCRNPGVEFINYESTLYDTMNLACDLRATRNVFDFPVPSKYHINPRNWTALVNLVHDSMINYEKRIDDFKHFKRLSRSTSIMARSQVDIHYFSRDVLFRTYCGSYAECRRVYPWAVAVWTLYPMAMIEVVADVNLDQESVDNDLLQIALTELMTSKYFKIYNTIAHVAPVDLFPRTPCAYMVYMDVSFIPFGRDFLNTHVAALVKDPRPIVYWQEDKLAIAVMHARPYMKLFRDAAGGKALYVETDFTIRVIGNPDTYADLVKVCGEAQPVPGSYFATLKSGEPFNQGHLKEVLKQYPSMPTGPCDETNSKSTVTAQRRVSSYSFFRPHQKNHNTHNNHHHQRERTYHASEHRCAPPEDLIIDALYVPMPLVGDNTVNTPGYATGPAFWLTSSLSPLPFKTVFKLFSKTQIETIVQHLDPILYNSYMRKIISLIPSDIADAFKVFDAIDYPNVISLRDMEYPHWGEECDK